MPPRGLALRDRPRIRNQVSDVYLHGVTNFLNATTDNKLLSSIVKYLLTLILAGMELLFSSFCGKQQCLQNVCH